MNYAKGSPSTDDVTPMVNWHSLEPGFLPPATKLIIYEWKINGGKEPEDFSHVLDAGDVSWHGLELVL